MVKLRLIFIHLASYLAIVVSVFGLATISYLILPIPAVKMMLGGMAAIYAIIALGIYLYSFVFSFKELKYEGKFVSKKPQEYSSDIQDYVDFLTTEEFKYVGVLENGRAFKKPFRSLVYLNPSRTVNAQITHFDDSEDSYVSFSTYWDGTHYVATVLNPKEDVVLNMKRHNDHLISRKHAPIDEIYRMHLSNVKEFYARLGQPQRMSSPQQLIDWETESKVINVLDEVSAGAKILPPVLIAVGMLSLSLIALVMLPLLFFGLLPLSPDFSIYRLWILLVLMGILMSFVYPRLLKNANTKEKSKNKSVDDEIDDLLSDMS